MTAISQKKKARQSGQAMQNLTRRPAKKAKPYKMVPLSHPPEECRELLTSQLIQDPHQPRKKFRRDAMEELSASIKSQGLQQPVNVTFAYKKDGIDYFYIKHGERRYQAHKLLCLKTVKCFILKEVYNGELSIIRLLEQSAENNAREPQTHGENIRVVKLVVENTLRNAFGGKTHGLIEIALTKVASAHGKKMSWAKNYYVLSGLHADLCEMLDHDGEERLNVQVALSLARAPHEKQQELLERAKPHFAKNFHVGLNFIAREARVLREENGEKMRGRQSEHKENFMNFANKLLRLSEQFQGPIASNKDWPQYLGKMLSSMSVLEAERMANTLRLAVMPFGEAFKLLEEKRADHMNGLGGRR